MADFMVLFRLPLAPGSKLASSLISMGWQCVNDNVYCRNIVSSRDEVISQIKTLCSESSDVESGMRTSAFTVIQLPRRSRMLSAVR